MRSYSNGDKTSCQHAAHFYHVFYKTTRETVSRAFEKFAITEGQKQLIYGINSLASENEKLKIISNFVHYD